MSKLYRYTIKFHRPFEESLLIHRVFGVFAQTEHDAVARLKKEWPDVIIDSITNEGEKRFI